MKTALYIGRFQPFHKGHMDVLGHIDSEQDIGYIVIGIGSVQYHDRNKNPYSGWSKNCFTYEETKSMLERSLDIRKPYSIHPIPDFHDYDKWFRHIEEELPAFDCLYSNNKGDKDYFTERGYEVRPFPKIFDFCATRIREMIYNDEAYASTLPEGTLDVMGEIDGAERIRNLIAKDIAERLR